LILTVEQGAAAVGTISDPSNRMNLTGAAPTFDRNLPANQPASLEGSDRVTVSIADSPDTASIACAAAHLLTPSPHQILNTGLMSGDTACRVVAIMA
jgi:hypothetical protein